LAAAPDRDLPKTRVGRPQHRGVKGKNCDLYNSRDDKRPLAEKGRFLGSQAKMPTAVIYRNASNMAKTGRRSGMNMPDFGPSPDDPCGAKPLFSRSISRFGAASDAQFARRY